MLKNITFSAEPELIAKARKVAKNNNSTLNAEFREWLEQFVKSDESKKLDLDQILAQMPHIKFERKFTRDEMNER